MDGLIEGLQQADFVLYRWIQDFSGKSALLDGLMGVLTSNPLFKGMFPALAFWYVWFLPERPGQMSFTVRRNWLCAILASTVIAIIVGRTSANFLPFRQRPNATPEFFDKVTVMTHPEFYSEWSSLPSDHAVMYFCLATGFLLIHRTVGVILMLHAAFVISLSRAYKGLHFPGDLLAGAVLGILVALIIVPWLGRKLSGSTSAWQPSQLAASRPYLLYPALFFLTFQFASMFDTVRETGGQLLRGVRILVGVT